MNVKIFPFSRKIKRRAVISGFFVLLWAVMLVSRRDNFFAAENGSKKEIWIEWLALGMAVFYLALPLYRRILQSLKKGFLSGELNAVAAVVIAGFLLLTNKNPAGVFVYLFFIYSLIFRELLFGLLLRKTKTLSNTLALEDKKSYFYVSKINHDATVLTVFFVLIGLAVSIALGISADRLILLSLYALAVAAPFAAQWHSFFPELKVFWLAEGEKIYFKDRSSLKKLSSASDFVFSIGGVLIEKKLELDEILAAQPNRVFSLALALERDIKHPIAEALQRSRKYKAENIFAYNIEHYKDRGVVGTVDQKKVAVGSLELMKQENIVVGVLQREKNRLEKKQKLVVALGCPEKDDRFAKKPGEILGLLVFKVTLKKESQAVVRRLKKEKIKSWVVSAHSPLFCEAVAKALKIPTDHVFSAADQKQKLTVLLRIMGETSSQRQVWLLRYGLAGKTKTPILKLFRAGAGGKLKLGAVIASSRSSAALKALLLSKKAAKIIGINRSIVFFYHLSAVALYIYLAAAPSFDIFWTVAAVWANFAVLTLIVLNSQIPDYKKFAVFLAKFLFFIPQKFDKKEG